MRLKTFDRVIIVVALMAIMITAAFSVSASSSYQSTLSLGAGNAFWGSLRSYDGEGNLRIRFTGSGSEGNWGQNVIEPYERILGFDWACGYQYVGTSADATWTNCPTGKYKFYFYNNGTTEWNSNAVYMTSW